MFLSPAVLKTQSLFAHSQRLAPTQLNELYTLLQACKRNTTSLLSLCNLHLFTQNNILLWCAFNIYHPEAKLQYSVTCTFKISHETLNAVGDKHRPSFYCVCVADSCPDSSCC